MIRMMSGYFFLIIEKFHAKLYENLKNNALNPTFMDHRVWCMYFLYNSPEWPTGISLLVDVLFKRKKRILHFTEKFSKSLINYMVRHRVSQKLWP